MMVDPQSSRRFRILPLKTKSKKRIAFLMSLMSFIRCKRKLRQKRHKQRYKLEMIHSKKKQKTSRFKRILKLRSLARFTQSRQRMTFSRIKFRISILLSLSLRFLKVVPSSSIFCKLGAISTMLALQVSRSLIAMEIRSMWVALKISQPTLLTLICSWDKELIQEQSTS